MGTQGRKDKVGYLLLSLLGAQPCPSNKINDVSNSVTTEGKHKFHSIKKEEEEVVKYIISIMKVSDSIFVFLNLFNLVRLLFIIF